MCCFSCEVLLHGNCWVYVWWCLCGLKSVCVCQTVLWEREGVKEGGRVYEWEELGRVGEWGSEGVRWRKERREQGRETGCTFNSQTTHVVFSIPLLNWQCFAVKSITTHNLNQTQHAPVHNCQVLLHGTCWVYAWWCLCGLKSVCVCQTVLWEREGAQEGGTLYEWDQLGRVG